MKTIAAMKLEHMTRADMELLMKIWPLIEKDKNIIVDAFYKHLVQFDEIKVLVRIVEQKVREQKIKGDLRYLLSLWVVGLFSGVYDEHYSNGVRTTLGKYIKVGIPLSVMLSSLAYLRNLICFYICSEIQHENPNSVTKMSQAVNKIIDYNLLITCETYMKNSNNIIFRSKF